MKKLALLMVVLLAVGGQASALVGHDCPDDSDVCIMNGGEDNQTGNQTEPNNDVIASADYPLIGGVVAGIVLVAGAIYYWKFW